MGIIPNETCLRCKYFERRPFGFYRSNLKPYCRYHLTYLDELDPAKIEWCVMGNLVKRYKKVVGKLTIAKVRIKFDGKFRSKYIEPPPIVGSSDK